MDGSVATSFDGVNSQMSVSTQVKTLTVNPAFLQEIKDSNLNLWKVLEQLVTLCSSPEDRGQKLRQLVPLLGEVRDLLALQFALEETYGYMEVPSSIAPVNSHLMQDIRSQHCSLYLMINELTEQAEELQYRGVDGDKVSQVNRLIDDVHQFELRFRDHERMEQDLIDCSRPVKLRPR
jgi:hypothetical protein